MGKGKGALSRYCSRVLQNHSLFEFSGFNLREVLVLKKIFNKKVNIPTKINVDFFKNSSYIFSNTNESLFCIKKYQK